MEMFQNTNNNMYFLFFTLLCNLLAESEQIVEPPKATEKKKARRETWNHITAPNKHMQMIVKCVTCNNYQVQNFFLRYITS